MLSMGECKDPVFQDPWFLYGRAMKKGKEDCVIDEDGHDHDDDHNEAYKISRSSSSSESSSFEASTISNESLSSIDVADDASSSLSSCLSSSNSHEGLYDLAGLMAELPIKRGLSKYYQGKSESFTCLSRVTSIEDLAKKVTPYKRIKLMKTSKSYGGLDTYKCHTLPKRVISKKGSLSSSFLSRSGSSVSSGCKPPLIPVHKNLGC